MNATVVRPLMVDSLRLEGMRLIGYSWPNGQEVEVGVIQEKHEEGVRWSLKNGQYIESLLRRYNVFYVEGATRIIYTTAPQDYDYGCSFTLEVFQCAPYPSDREREWRKVLIMGKNGFTEAQEARYRSGLHAPTEVDPRETRRQEDARRAAEQADKEALEAMTMEDLEGEVRNRRPQNPYVPEGWDAYGRADRILSRRQKEVQDSQRRQVFEEMKNKITGKVLVVNGEVMEVVTIYELKENEKPHTSLVLMGKDNGTLDTFPIIDVVRLVEAGQTAPSAIPSRKDRQALWKAGMNPLQVKKISLGEKDFFVGHSRHEDQLDSSSELVVVDVDTGKRTKRRAVVDSVTQRFRDTQR